jgi:hypothetical protein
LAGSELLHSLLYLLFQPFRNWLGSKCLAQDFAHDFEFTPLRMISSIFLLSDLAVKLADFQTKHDFLLPGHERLHEESAISFTIAIDRHGQNVTTAHSIIDV